MKYYRGCRGKEFHGIHPIPIHKTVSKKIRFEVSLQTLQTGC